MAKKTLKDAELADRLKSDRPDGLIILSEEDSQAIADTIKHLRGEIDKLKGKNKEAK